MNVFKPTYNNKGHARAHAAGAAAARAGKLRISPYGCANRCQLDYRRAWLAGYDEVAGK